MCVLQINLVILQEGYITWLHSFSFVIYVFQLITQLTSFLPPFLYFLSFYSLYFHSFPLLSFLFFFPSVLIFTFSHFLFSLCFLLLLFSHPSLHSFSFSFIHWLLLFNHPASTTPPILYCLSFYLFSSSSSFYSSFTFFLSTPILHIVFILSFLSFISSLLLSHLLAVHSIESSVCFVIWSEWNLLPWQHLVKCMHHMAD